ncbi:HIT family protein [Pelagibacterium xiamenense]|uniref:HIT family protein n=1 Tax=Pelagibacterium xiamenense TaxID=2901140 RepID=UPI001E505374|nr:HIT domain-containing protein [Pelagibacterium xiamenense]MCD7059094.1 HIT domain-containing protein [Pelagibacterium xiamenense]
MDERKPFDLDAYIRSIAEQPCFICKLVDRDPAFRHHVVFEDDETIIFLSKYPTLRGYCLVCPREHLEDLADLPRRQYLDLQAHVHRLSGVLKTLFGAERIYVLSLGSQQANSHLHFHVVPLPPGIPLEKQQYHALMAENGILDIPEAEMEAMASKIGAAYAAL